MEHFVRIDVTATSDNKMPVAPDKIISGRPVQSAVNQFSNNKENFFVGTWESNAGKWTISYNEDEFLTILEGEVILTEVGGEPQHLKVGDQLVISSGFNGTWETIGHVKKLYAIYED